MATTTDKVAKRDAVKRILQWPAHRLDIAALGTRMQSGGQAALRQAFARLLRQAMSPRSKNARLWNFHKRA